MGNLVGSFNVVEAASTVRNPKNLDYILSKYEKCREVGINFAKMGGKVETDRIIKGQRLKKENA